MRHSARREQNDIADPSDIMEEVSTPVSTVENPLMEELHTVQASAVPAWKTKSVVVEQEPEKKDPFRTNSMFVSIDEELSSTLSRPIAPSTATIISEEEVKERFSYSDEQLEYKKGMPFGERMKVTFRKIAVWFSDVWDKYVLFMKKHFPVIFESHDVSKITTIGCCILFVLVGIIVVCVVALR